MIIYPAFNRCESVLEQWHFKMADINLHLLTFLDLFIFSLGVFDSETIVSKLAGKTVAHKNRVKDPIIEMKAIEEQLATNGNAYCCYTYGC